jgi:23S rRNA-intervening sequence protein
MGKLESYRDLEVWKMSLRLAREVYQATGVMPKHEIYGLTSQIRRACVPPQNVYSTVSVKASKGVRYQLTSPHPKPHTLNPTPTP